jgi:CheY-like chemotaxis protein
MSRVLVIDDEHPVRRLLRTVLERAGHTVLEAQDGREGMALWRQAPTEVVVTDIFMPEKDGVQVLMELKRVATKPKIIVMSGADLKRLFDLKSAARLLGADQVLSKPFDPQTLLLAVEGSLKVIPQSPSVTVRSGLNDARKYPRFPVALPASFSDGESVLAGTVMDISREGCRIRSADAVPSEKYFGVEIEVEGLSERLSVNLAVMRWTRQGEFGVEFIRMDPESQALLRRIIRDCEDTIAIADGREDPGRRLGERPNDAPP